MLHNVTYDVVKLLHQLSCISWFIQKHAQQDAQKENNKALSELLKNLNNDLEKYINELHALVQK